MKKIKILCLAVLMLCVTQYSKAIVTTGQTTNATYLQNQGYSPEATRMVDLAKSQATGKSTPNTEKQHTKFVNFLKKVQAYIDPAIDNDDFGKHVVKEKPGVNDL